MKANEWASNINEKESILKEMLDYMPFAWEKANGCRGNFCISLNATL